MIYSFLFSNHCTRPNLVVFQYDSPIGLTMEQSTHIDNATTSKHCKRTHSSATLTSTGVTEARGPFAVLTNKNKRRRSKEEDKLQKKSLLYIFQPNKTRSTRATPLEQE